MIPSLLPAATGILFLATGFFALAAFALRDFSWNRIDDIAKRRKVEHRFGDILEQHLEAQLAVEISLCLAFAGLMGLLYLQADFSTWNAHDPSTWSSIIGRLLRWALLLVVWVIVIPRTWSRVSGEKFLVRAWPLLRVLRKVLSPLLKIFGKFDQLVHRMAGVPEPETGMLLTLTQEILSVVDEGQREGLIEPQARTMIHRVMELREGDVAAIMTPRTEMHVVQVETPLEEARRILLEGGHSRVPVVGETTDDIIGILYAKDLLRYVHEGNGQAATLRDIVRDAIYVPETTGIDKLLERMKREHVHMAIVIDEYSGVAGLVTLEDILEEIVGEITDEYDEEEEEDILQIADNILEVDARVHVDELNELYQFDLPEDGDFETIGGFVFNHLGRVPKNRESFSWRNLQITILNVGKRRINKLRIEVDRTVAATTSEES